MNIDYLDPIYNILSTDADILSIIGAVSAGNEKIFFNDAPKDTERYIVIYEISDTPIDISKLHNKRLQINIYNTNQFTCAQLAEYVKTALHTLQGASSGVVFTSIYNTQSLGMTQTETGEYIIVQDYIVRY